MVKNAPRVDRGRDGARAHAQRLLAGRPGHDGLLDRALRPHGRIVAQGLTLAVQLGTFPTLMRYVLEELGPRRSRATSSSPTTHTAAAAQHLPDIYMIKPIFVDGALEG